MLDDEGVVKVGDLGQSRLKEQSVDYFSTGQPGAVPFMPPEALSEKPHYTEKIDTFSLGVLMLEVTTGRYPSVKLAGIGLQPEVVRRRGDLSRLADDHPLKPFILECLKDDYKERPSATLVRCFLESQVKSADTLKNIHSIPEDNKRNVQSDIADIYRDAFKDGKAVEVHIVKCVTMGPPEAGKTQLKRALLGDFTIAEESTPACTKATPAVEMMLASETEWKPFEFEHLKTLSLQEDLPRVSPRITTVTNTTTICSVENDSHSSLDFIVEAVSDPQPDQSIPGYTTSRSNTSESSLAIRRQKNTESFHSLLMSVTESLAKSNCCNQNFKSMKLIYMVDSGGQPSFLDFHPVTATFAATYMLVYNMKEGLDAKPEMSYRTPIPTKKLPPSTKTNLEILHRSMLTVHHFQARFDQQHDKIIELMKDEFKFRAAPATPPIFIIGTRKVQSSTSSHSKKLKPLYQNIPSLKRTTSLKFVESTSPNCEGTKELRDAISNEDSLCSFRLPLSWLKLHLMSVVLESNPEKERFKKELQVQTYSNLCQMCLNENIVRSTEEFKAMITVFHSLGVFSCPDLEFKETQDQIEEYLIFLNPNILYGFVSKMLEIPFIDLDKWRNRSSLKDLQLAGELTVTALEDLDIPDKIGTCDGIHRRLLSWLVHWGLAAPMDAEGKLFIPSVLPLQPDLPSPFRGTPFDPFPLQFCFIYDSTKNYTFHYLPRGFFPHFVVTLVKGGYTLHENALDPEDDEIVPRCRDAISLIRQRQKFDGAKNTFNIQLVDKGTHISIHMFPADLKAKDTRREAGRVLADLKKKIEDTNEKLYYRSHDEIALCCDCTCRSEQRILDCHLARIDVGNGDDGIPITCLHPKRACNLAWENNLTDDLLRAVIETFHQISGQFVSRSAADNMPSASTSVVNSMPTMDTSVQQFSSKRGQRTPDSPVEPAKRLRRSGAPSDEWDLAPTYRQMEQDTFCTRRSSGKLKHLQEQSSEHNVSQDSSLDPDLAIKSTTDLLPYLDNMKTQLKLLGCSLGIQSETAAIEKTSEDSTTKCLQILEHWLKVNANPSWSLLCSKLKGCESFNNVREQMEKDHFQ